MLAELFRAVYEQQDEGAAPAADRRRPARKK